MQMNKSGVDSSTPSVMKQHSVLVRQSMTNPTENQRNSTTANSSMNRRITTSNTYTRFKAFNINETPLMDRNFMSFSSAFMPQLVSHPPTSHCLDRRTIATAAAQNLKQRLSGVELPKNEDIEQSINISNQSMRFLSKKFQQRGLTSNRVEQTSENMFLNGGGNQNINNFMTEVNRPLYPE